MNEEKSKKGWIKNILTLLVLILSGIYLYNNQNEILASFTGINYIYLVIAGLLYLISVTLNGLALKFLAQPYSIDMKEHIPLSYISLFFNSFTPAKGGAVYRGVYLKKKYNLNYSDYISSFFGHFIIISIVNSALALLALLFIGNISMEVLLVFGTILIGSVLFIIFNRYISRFKLPKVVKKLIDGWQKLFVHKEVLLKLSLLTFFLYFVNTAELYFFVRAVGFNIDIQSIFIISSASYLSSFAQLTPGSIGIMEGVMAITASIINIQSSIIIVAQVLRRLVEAILIIIGGLISQIILNKELDK